MTRLLMLRICRRVHTKQRYHCKGKATCPDICFNLCASLTCTKDVREVETLISLRTSYKQKCYPGESFGLYYQGSLPKASSAAWLSMGKDQSCLSQGTAARSPGIYYRVQKEMLPRIVH